MLSKEDLMVMLSAGANRKEELFAAAQAARQRIFGNRVFLYGFLYLSTYCRNDCTFCQYRKSNVALGRYRKSTEELVDAARKLAADGVHLLDLTLGEDPYFVEPLGFHRLVRLVSALKEATGLPIMISPGVMSKDQLRALKEAGADWYACYQETRDPELFARLRTGQDYGLRAGTRADAVAVGLLAEDGLLTGSGETTEALADSILAMSRERLGQVRAMSYVPHESTFPSSAGSTLEARREHELLAIAAMRLAMPDRLIPASLDVDGLEGLAMRLRAGANVVTSIVPSGCGLAGVATRDLDIENQRRSVAAVTEQLERCGMVPASVGDYRAWMDAALPFFGGGNEGSLSGESGRCPEPHRGE